MELKENRMDKLIEVFKNEFSFVDQIPEFLPESLENNFNHIFYKENFFKENKEDFEKMFAPLSMMQLRDHYMFREYFVNRGMFAFVSWKWVLPFVEWIGKRKCLEVMSGAGWLSYALRSKDVDIITTDDYSWMGEYFYDEPLTEVEKLDAVEAVKKYGKDVEIVIMSWPYMDKTAYKVIKKLYEVNPEAIVVYIGEGSGGCTANYSFFNNFKEIDDEDFYKVSSNFQSWKGIRDNISIGRYTPLKNK